MSYLLGAIMILWIIWATIQVAIGLFQIGTGIGCMILGRFLICLGWAVGCVETLIYHLRRR